MQLLNELKFHLLSETLKASADGMISVIQNCALHLQGKKHTLSQRHRHQGKGMTATARKQQSNVGKLQVFKGSREEILILNVQRSRPVASGLLPSIMALRSKRLCGLNACYQRRI